MAVAVPIRGASTDVSKLVSLWRERIGQARDHRREFEPGFLSDFAFASGQHWLVWDPQQRKMRHRADVDPQYEDRELYVADRINEQRQAQLGELSAGDDRPQLLLAQQGDTAEAVQREINHAVAYGWEHEWGADQALLQARRLCVDVGVSAIRCRFDPTKGPIATHVPINQAGQPVLDRPTLDHLETHGQMPDGSLPRFKPVHEGRTVWEPLSAFNLLTPPGVTHEDAFPWEVVVRPVLIDHLIEEYGAVAEGLDEDTDIGSIIGLATSQQGAASGGAQTSTRGRLRGHVWLFTCYTRPCRTYPDGQVVVLASNSFRLLDARDQLDYKAPDGTFRSGVHYLHFWRLSDRFWSRSFISPMKDPQRIINETETVNREVFRRGLPKVFVKEGALVQNPQGLPLEVVELADTSLEPHFFAGITPNAAMYTELEHQADNLAHASTLSPLRLGENPANVHTYSQLALLNENEALKRSTIVQEHEQTKARLIEDSVWDIRRYWPEEKQILVAGDEDQISQQVFRKSRIPDFYVVKVAKGATKPRSQGAELTKIDAIWAAAVATGVVTGPNGAKWVDWYSASLDAGEALDLPAEEQNSQVDLAHFENFLMLNKGELPQPADHDVMPVHIPIHREALDQARASGDAAAAQLILRHIEESTQLATTARKAWRFLDPTDTNDLASDLALDEDQALHENEMLFQGVPLNPEEYRKAYAALQQGVNPETGQQIDILNTPPAAIQQTLRDVLERAALKPTLVENLELHMDRHGKVIKSEAFKQFPDDVRRRFLTHFDLTRELWLSLPQMPEKIESPKVSLQLRESVGPSTIATVLHRAGVPDADPGLLASEQPMANMVQEDVAPAAPQPATPSDQGAQQ